MRAYKSPFFDVVCPNSQLDRLVSPLHPEPGVLLQHIELWSLLLDEARLSVHEVGHLVEKAVSCHKVFGHLFLNFFVHLSHDRLEVVLKLNLQFLMVASALICSPFFQYFCQSKKDLASPPLSLCEKLTVIVLHKLQVDVVLPSTPGSR